jgi:hypothetical protein
MIDQRPRAGDTETKPDRKTEPKPKTPAPAKEPDPTKLPDGDPDYDPGICPISPDDVLDTSFSCSLSA